MAHLVKLNEYISRYETDLTRYTSLFVRLKTRRWHSRMKPASGMAAHAGSLSEEEWKQRFLDELFLSQIKWASSTTMRRSYPNSSYFSDTRLRSLLQRIPDTYLVFYQPTFELKRAKLEMEALLLGPSHLDCITFLDNEKNALFREGEGHFWLKSSKSGEEKVVNPMIAANRTARIISQIFKLHDVELPVQKIVMAQEGFITEPRMPEDILFIDRQNYERWLTKLRSYHSPMKMMQVRAAKLLLSYCATKSVKRTDWPVS